MPEDQIHIRLAEEGTAFIYSIVRAGALIETAVVRPIKEEGGEDFATAEYYGGSQVMD